MQVWFGRSFVTQSSAAGLHDELKKAAYFVFAYFSRTLSPVFHVMTIETEFLTQLAAPTLLGQPVLPESCYLSSEVDPQR